MLNILLCITSVVMVLAVYFARQKHKEAKYYAEQWQKWEREYWLLRSSEAIQDGFEIHVSWLPRGEDRCITRNT